MLPVPAVAAASQEPEDEEDLRTTLAALTLLLVAMWLGSLLSQLFVDLGVTLPGYVGAMLVGALIRNLADVSGLLVVPESRTSSIGAVCLTLFLTIALMNLKLWELAAVALPLIISHGSCQPPPSNALGDDLPHPFAALAGLKLPKP